MIPQSTASLDGGRKATPINLQTIRGLVDRKNSLTPTGISLGRWSVSDHERVLYPVPGIILRTYIVTSDYVDFVSRQLV